MTTQVIFTIDKKLKNEAMQKARFLGLPFSSVLNLATRAFVAGKLNVEMVEVPRFNVKTAKVLRSALSDITKGKNIVGSFDSPKEMDKFLDSLNK